MLKEEKTNKLNELINKFKSNIIEYKSNKYNEIKNKDEFIDNFFELLDWDLKSEKKLASFEKDVNRDDSIYTKTSINAPDYTFKIGSEKKFFVEAKKPFIFLKEDINAAFYLRSYAYSANVPLSILTDFEEFSVYDTRFIPNANDKADNSRIFYFHIDEYANNFELIYNLFSKNAILQGSFDKYTKENPVNNTALTIEETILSLLKKWEAELQNNIILKNKNIDQNKLKEAVFKIIAKIIFLRILEDKNIEPQRKIMEMSGQNSVYKNLISMFNEANRKYKYDLFDNIDWINNIIIDDKVIRNLISGMYYPKCPYQFSAIPIVILSNVFKRFINNDKTITDGKIFNNNLIIDCIDKKANEITDLKRFMKFKIIDPVNCSVNFLINVYSILLDIYLKYFLKDIQKSLKEERVCLSLNNDYQLTFIEKLNILLNNIYGIDKNNLNVIAVELCLYLKLIENENKISLSSLINKNFKIFPSLENNIKSGNSLIDNNFYNDKDIVLINNEKKLSINAFDWDVEFTDVFNAGGFDFIIGDLTNNTEISEEETKYLEEKFNIKNMDLAGFYILTAMKYLKKEGVIGFVISKTFFDSSSRHKINEILNTEAVEFINNPDPDNNNQYKQIILKKK